MDNPQVRVSEEIFKIHPIYTRLEVGCYGTIRDSKTHTIRYTNIGKSGYYVFLYKIKGKPKGLKVHRLVAEMFLEPPPPDLIEKCSKEHWGVVLVKHLDNNKLNNSYLNLQWSDTAGNNKQAYDDELVPYLKGELNGRSKLTDEFVHSLCLDYQNGMKPKDAVVKYGISEQQATKIRAGHAWKHISSQYQIKVNKRSNSNDQSVMT